MTQGVPPPAGILRSRLAFALALLFSAYEALPPSVTTLRTGGAAAAQPHALPIFGTALVFFIRRQVRLWCCGGSFGRAGIAQVATVGDRCRRIAAVPDPRLAQR